MPEMPDELHSLVVEARHTTAVASFRAAAELLLRDFCACAHAGIDVVAPGTWPDDGVAGRIALLAYRAHAHDRDDVDWATLTHPGSVVWPVVLGLGLTDDAALGAAAFGYEVAHRVAGRLKAATQWHLTAVAGQAGAAAVASTALGLDDIATAEAVALSLSTAGVLATSVVARTNAPRHHRAAAAVGGLLAARAVSQGVRAAPDVLHRRGGVIEVLAGGHVSVAESPTDTCAIEATSVRLFPTNGFAQAAIAAAVDLRATLGHTPVEATVDVSTVFARALSDGGPDEWWDARGAVAAALVTGDSWSVGDASVRARDDVRRTRDRVMIRANGEFRLEASIVAEGATCCVPEPPGLRVIDSVADLHVKWRQLDDEGPSGATAADLVLAGDSSGIDQLTGP